MVSRPEKIQEVERLTRSESRLRILDKLRECGPMKRAELEKRIDVSRVIDVLPPEKEMNVYGQSMDGEAIEVTFPSYLDDGPGEWRDIHPAKLASYCSDQEIKLYTYKHTSLELA